MKKEILAPAGNMEALKAAIYNGADAVYLGGKKFGARKFANNFDENEMIEAINFVHLYGKKIYVTVNTIVFNDEIDECLKYIEFLHRNNVDALIMQDLGLISLVHKKFPNLEIHASTQAHNYNNENIKFLKNLGVKRVVLAREVSIDEINKFDNNMDLEIFIHGALCVSYSGCCLFSSLNGSRSGNRGECVGSCRLPYKLSDGENIMETDGDYLLSMKDLYTAPYFKQILDSKVISLKIEGRMKSPEYVGFVTRFYRDLIDNYEKTGKIEINENDLKSLKVLFNREFTKGYLLEEENNEITNINSSNHIGIPIGKVVELKKDKIKIKLTCELNQEDGIRFVSNNSGMIVNMLYNESGLLINHANAGDTIFVDNKVNLKKYSLVSKTIDKKLIDKLKNIEIPRIDINIKIEAYLNQPLKITISDQKISLVKEYNIIDAALKSPITKENIINQFSKTNDTIYRPIINVKMDNSIFISLKYLNEVRRDILNCFKEEKLRKKEIEINDQKIIFNNYHSEKKEISILVRNEEQLKVCLNHNVDIYVTDYALYKKYKQDNIYLRLERVITNYPNFENENLLITETGSIKYAKNNNVIADYYLNIVNDYSINLLHNLGIRKVTLSVEMDEEKINSLSLKNFNVELIVYGRAELMIMKYCPLNKILNNGKKPCSICKNNYYLKDNEKFYPIITKNCLTHILHYKNIDLINSVKHYQNINNFRIELFDENEYEVEKLINQLKKEIE